jgi:hypothetical protein
MPVKRRHPKQHRGTDPVVWAVLSDEPLPPDADTFGAFLLSYPDRFNPCAEWQALGADVVREYAAKHPGRRPTRWWIYDAPPAGERGCIEMRKRLGGIGTPACEHLAFQPFQQELGIPSAWISVDDLRLFELSCAPVDLDDPPIFESQANYLQRHGLLLPGEAERLSEADFEPETLLDILNFGGEPGVFSFTFGRPKTR